MEYLEEKYPDYSFTYSSYGSGLAYYEVDGFDSRVVVGVAQDEPLELYDNFQFIKYRDEIVDALDELAQIIIDAVDDSGYVFHIVRIDFTDNADEFAGTVDRRPTVYDYQYSFCAEPDDDGHITDYSWSEA